ncbi:MAG: TIGR03936 family radical SAM-associated protein [Clostridia bacterium]|nr:TIGR03936 family radical SAM-associated protein [Clostridia bacterium]
MKNVRLFYKKGGRMRFISHLDITRFMARIIKRAKLPVWFTEGFNPHPYITFALPLSLGHISEYDIMDIRLCDDDYDIEKLPETLNAICPDGIRFFKAAEPKLKTAFVAFAQFEIEFDDKGELLKPLSDFLKSESIEVSKKTKKGDIKTFDVKPKIKDFSLNENGNTVLKITLPAGSEENINPELILTAFFGSGVTNYSCYTVTRKSILDKDLNLFE